MTDSTTMDEVQLSWQKSERGKPIEIRLGYILVSDFVLK